MTTAALTVTQGDFEYIDEWITYHHNIGINLFCIAYNGNTKEFDKLPKYDYVKYFDISTNDLEIFTEFNSLISKRGWSWMWGDAIKIMYSYLKTFFKEYVKYVAVIDTDEFIFPQEDFNDITEYLDNIFDQNLGTEHISMQFYNGDNHIYYENKPILERFTTYVNDYEIDKNDCWAKKSIINLQYNDIDSLNVITFHENNLSNPTNTMPFDKIVLRHYMCKSLEEWIKKMAPKYDRDYFARFRGKIFGGWQGYFGVHLKNEISTEALKAIPELLKKYNIDYKPEIEEEDEGFKEKYKQANDLS